MDKDTAKIQNFLKTKHKKSGNRHLFQNAHDRFLFIDDTVYHIGASLKDLGKKWFAFSRTEIGGEGMLGKM